MRYEDIVVGKKYRYIAPAKMKASDLACGKTEFDVEILDKAEDIQWEFPNHVYGTYPDVGDLTDVVGLYEDLELSEIA
jgi:hypothetical protein